jgi:hypothetical protein
MKETEDRVGWKAKCRIDRFRDPTNNIAEALRMGMPIEQAVRMYHESYVGTEVFTANIALNEGLQELIDIVCGLGTPTKWDNVNTRLGVGDSNSAESATQTGLQATTNKTYKAMDANYPARTNQTAEWRATFGGDDANYAWEEYTVVNAADDTGKNLNRKTSSKGTKQSGESWVLSLQITFS